MARPQKKNTELLKRAVSIRLSEADFHSWNQKVSDSGLSASAFFRRAIIENRTWVKAKVTISVDKKRLIYLFNKSSNNINQLAHRANLDNLKGLVSDITYVSILKSLIDIQCMLKQGIHSVD